LGEPQSVAVVGGEGGGGCVVVEPATSTMTKVGSEVAGFD